MRRVLVIAATAVAMSIPASVAVVATSTSAFAASTTTCAKVKGTSTGTVALSKCVVPKVDKKTYHALTASSAALANGATATWTGGATVTVAKPVLTPGTHCAVGNTDLIATSSVTASTSDPAVVKVGDTVSLHVCVNAKGKISLAPGSNVQI